MFSLLLSTVYAQFTSPSYYFRIGPQIDGCAPVQSFDDGMSYGPCNNNNGVRYTSDSKYWVAIHAGGSHCGQSITAHYGAKTMALQIMDVCPGCSDGHIDMGLEALVELTGTKEIACSINNPLPKITWEFSNSGGEAVVNYTSYAVVQFNSTIDHVAVTVTTNASSASTVITPTSLSTTVTTMTSMTSTTTLNPTTTTVAATRLYDRLHGFAVITNEVLANSAETRGIWMALGAMGLVLV